MYWCCHHSSCSPGQQRSLPRVITKNLTAQERCSIFPSSAKKKSPRSHCSCGKPHERLLGTHSTEHCRHKLKGPPVCNDRQYLHFRGFEIGGYCGDAIGHLMQRDNSLEKTLMLGKLEGRRRRGWWSMRWWDGCHHWLDAHGFEQTPGDGDGQGSLACCSPWGHKESDMPEWLNEKEKAGAAPSRVSPSIALAAPSPGKEEPL